MKIVLIGAGSLAYCVALEMQRVGMKIHQVYSRTREHAEALARKLNCSWTTDTGDVVPDADLYIFAVNDNVLPDIVRKVKRNSGLWVHTSGCLPAEVFEGYAGRYGVFYPFQTFVPNRKIRLDETPVFLEANSPDDMKMLKKIAVALTGAAFETTFENRKAIHLAGIFAGDFAGYMYLQAAGLLEEKGLKYGLMLPMLKEVVDRLHTSTPSSIYENMISCRNGEIPDLSKMRKNSAVYKTYGFMNMRIEEEKAQDSENEKRE